MINQSDLYILLHRSMRTEPKDRAMIYTWIQIAVQRIQIKLSDEEQNEVINTYYYFKTKVDTALKLEEQVSLASAFNNGSLIEPDTGVF